MRRYYQQNKQLAISILQQGLPDCRLHATEAGLHLVLEFPQPIDEGQLLAGLSLHGIKAQPLSRYIFSATPRYGLVIGIANCNQVELAAALQQLIALSRQALPEQT